MSKMEDKSEAEKDIRKEKRRKWRRLYRKQKNEGEGSWVWLLISRLNEKMKEMEIKDRKRRGERRGEKNIGCKKVEENDWFCLFYVYIVLVRKQLEGKKRRKIEVKDWSEELKWRIEEKKWSEEQK